MVVYEDRYIFSLESKGLTDNSTRIILKGEAMELKRINLSQCHFVHQKSYLD
jgi:hypothetical protein